MFDIDPRVLVEKRLNSHCTRALSACVNVFCPSCARDCRIRKKIKKLKEIDRCGETEARGQKAKVFPLLLLAAWAIQKAKAVLCAGKR